MRSCGRGAHFGDVPGRRRHDMGNTVYRRLNLSHSVPRDQCLSRRIPPFGLVCLPVAVPERRSRRQPASGPRRSVARIPPQDAWRRGVERASISAEAPGSSRVNHGLRRADRLPASVQAATIRHAGRGGYGGGVGANSPLVPRACGAAWRHHRLCVGENTISGLVGTIDSNGMREWRRGGIGTLAPC